MAADDDVVRVLSGALSGIVDLAATDATTTMLVNVLVSVGQFQRDLQNELTREGLAAAWAQGSTSGRRPRVAQLGAIDEVRQAFRDGASIAALARAHEVSRGAIRTAVADLLPNQPERPAPAAAAAEVIGVEMPGKIVAQGRNGRRAPHQLVEPQPSGGSIRPSFKIQYSTLR